MITLGDIKKCENKFTMLDNARKFIMEKYDFLSENDAKISYCTYNDNGIEKYSAQVKYGYNWSNCYENLTDAVVAAIHIFIDERTRCKEYNDDIDDMYD